MKYLVFVFSSIILFASCNTTKMNETPESQFLGKWKLVDRGMLDDIEIKISNDEKGNFSGTITKLNDNKYVQMFMEKGDVLVSGISRKSNFEFMLSEKKIAAPLFSAYDQSTTAELDVQFEHKNKILVGKNGIGGKYIRIK